MAHEYQEVGSVLTLSRFPVKSMAGERIDETRVGWHGLDGDRRFAFLQSQNSSGFPWFTAREYPRLILYQPYFVNPSDVRNSPIGVKTPDGLDLPVDGSELVDQLQRESHRSIQLIQVWSGIFDAMDISLITKTTEESLEGMLGCELDSRRFRSNITIEPLVENKRPFPEDKWVGCLLKFGDRDDSARIRVNRKDVRCMVVNVDPNSAHQNPAVLKEIVAKRKNQLGVYATTERPGTIKIGDSVFIVK